MGNPNASEVHARRLQVLVFVQKTTPGTTATEVAEEIGIHRTQATNHLKRLEKEGRISVREINSRTKIWYVDAGDNESAEQIFGDIAQIVGFDADDSQYPGYMNKEQLQQTVDWIANRQAPEPDY